MCFYLYLSRFHARLSSQEFSSVMLHGRSATIGLIILNFAATAVQSADEPRASLANGDRVVWIGGTLVEREQVYGYWETMLTASFPDRKVTFRNLGWAGDTVWAESRGMFDPPEQGYARLLEMSKELKPTLIILAYGGNEAFGGDAEIEPFIRQFRKLVNDLSAEETRFLFLLPPDMDPRFERYSAAAALYNAGVVKYRDAIRELAGEFKSPVIDLTKPASEESRLAGQPTTTDGLNLTAFGYWALAHRLRDQFDVTRKGITLPMPVSAYPAEPTVSSSDRLERMRDEVVRKNELFFHRWRPQNFTYIFGFRKYEQGNNAVEIPRFDPLIEKREAAIDSLRTGN
jgi:lysophospholipase L1-like esterase